MTLSFVAGVITAGYLIAALFLLRFWARTGDAFFLLFFCAFALLALSQALVALSGVEREEQTWFYFLRLAAFLLVILAMVRKNTSAKSE